MLKLRAKGVGVNLLPAQNLTQHQSTLFSETIVSEFRIKFGTPYSLIPSWEQG